MFSPSACYANFCFLLTALLLPGLAKADNYRILNNGIEALQTRIDLIQQAHESLDLQYYHWADDITGRQIFGLLKEAVDRKVKVRIIIDSKHSNIPPAVKTYLKESKIELREYLPFQILHAKTWIHSMHNKLMIVDGKTLLMGGRNMDSGYFELPAKQKFHDREVMIEGSAVNEAHDYFESLWNSNNLSERCQKLKRQTPEEAGAMLDEAVQRLSQDPSLHSNTHDDLNKGNSSTHEVYFLHDLLSAKKYDHPVRDQLFKLAASAQKSITIEIAYLTVTNDLRQIFQSALDRGVRIRILTNSLESNDVLAAQAAYLARRKLLIRMGIEVWEYTGKTTLHIKSSVIDDKIAIIGSYNLDPVSQNLNSETISYVEDSAVALELKRAMDENLSSAVKIDRDGYPEGQTKRFPGVPWSRVLRVQILRYLAVPLLKRFT